FNTIVSFDIFGKDDSLNAKTFMLGYSNNLYVSKNNIYITYQKNMPWDYYRYAKKEVFFKVIVPLLPANTAKEIEAIENNKNLGDNEKWEKISEKLENMYNQMEDETAKKELINTIKEAVLEYETKEQEKRQKTIIHKININKGEITYKTKGEVPGYLLNQFSMDEHENNFRVATTTSLWIRNKGRVQYYNVFVLDEKMKIEGKITGIAPDETIYSTRFMGDRLYMVTFKTIDPFFVIDLSSPKNPKILGELKIPGYSDYLHPYDSNHVIGIGKETDSNQWGGTSIKGVKIALFDVSDVENPKQVDKYEIGTSGTDSEALRDHKAFLFDKEKNILVIPIRKVEGDNYQKRSYWYGAYVLGITPEDGISKKGTITHSDYIQGEHYYDYLSAYEVRRSLYMDDVLYTISSKLIKMNNLDDLDEEINEIKLPYSDNYREYYW
ncbi:MAG: beta-propeller domain-containing protein, partial [Candidatus Aenigmarchaeota archaeon]|nr:beta-propeller domain-containing protein [Candidatus Aenigmarchaeota archaeon]